MGMMVAAHTAHAVPEDRVVWQRTMVWHGPFCMAINKMGAPAEDYLIVYSYRRSPLLVSCLACLTHVSHPTPHHTQPPHMPSNYQDRVSTVTAHN